MLEWTPLPGRFPIVGISWNMFSALLLFSKKLLLTPPATSLRQNLIESNGIQTLARGLVSPNNCVSYLRFVLVIFRFPTNKHIHSVGFNRLGVDGAVALANAIVNEECRLHTMLYVLTMWYYGLHSNVTYTGLRTTTLVIKALLQLHLRCSMVSAKSPI